MLRKKLSIWFFITALLTALWSPVALAHGNNHNGHHKPHHQPKQTLVALGDSFTFGSGLEQNMTRPSPYAFPAIMGQRTGMNVQNLAVPGAKTTDFIAALNSNQSLRQAVSKANYITLSVGGLDLIEAYNSGNQVTEAEARTVLANMGVAIAEIRKLSKAPLVIYNMPNPFPANTAIGREAARILPAFNTQLAALVQQSGDRSIVIADTYKAFLNCQAVYILPNDIHPSRLGHQKLAEIGLQALKLTKPAKHHHYQHQR